MVSKTPDAKGDRLSRYFKDLNESDLDSDLDSDEDEQSQNKEQTQFQLATESVSDAKMQTKKEESLSQHTYKPTETHVSKDENESTKSQHNESSDSTVVKPVLQKLPSASECLGNKMNSAFLNLDRKKEIDWDHSSHSILTEDSDDPPLDYKSNAVPPPSSYEPITDPGIKVVDSEGRKRKPDTEDSSDAAGSRKAYRIEKQEEDQS